MNIGRGLNNLRRLTGGNIALLTLLALPAQATNFNISFAGLASGQDSSFATLTSTSTLNGAGVNTINDPNLTIYGEDVAHATPTPVDAIFGSVTSLLNVTWDFNLAVSKLNGVGSGNCSGGPCGGLGVAGGSDKNVDALNGNDATHGDEALVINFGNGVVAANSISFDLRGYNNTGGLPDSVWLFVEFSPSNGSPSDVSLLLPAGSNTDTNTIALSALAGLNVTTPVAKIAILANEGNVGFGRIAYTQSSVVAPAPEPQTFALVGAAIFIFVKRRRATQR